MKKLVCMLLAVLLPASLGSAAFAENTVMDCDIMGIRMEVPEGYEKNSDEFRTLDVYSDLAIVIDKAA